MHSVKIIWSFGHTDVKSFKTKEERDSYLDKRQDDIDHVILNYQDFKKSTDDFYCPTRNMTDYEMDIYL